MNATRAERKAIGSVITTLILLIAGIVLSSGVVFYGTSIFQTSSKQESIQVTNQHIWVNATNGVSQAVFVLQNTGDTVVAVNSITIRGQSIPTSSWYYNTNKSVTTISNVQNELKFTGVALSGSSATIQLPGAPSSATFTQATMPVTVYQGQIVIIYLNQPANLGMNDIGQKIYLEISAGKQSPVSWISVISS